MGCFEKYLWNINKKISCEEYLKEFLEAAVGFNTPGIVKYSFWRMTHQWKNAVYVCLNNGEAYMPDEIKDKYICINGDIREILYRLWRKTKTCCVSEGGPWQFMTARKSPGPIDYCLPGFAARRFHEFLMWQTRDWGYLKWGSSCPVLCALAAVKNEAISSNAGNPERRDFPGGLTLLLKQGCPNSTGFRGSG